MNKGDRKLKACYFVIACIMVSFVIALVLGVKFSGDNLVTLWFVLGGIAGMFFGGNAAEWIAQRPSSSLRTPSALTPASLPKSEGN